MRRRNKAEGRTYVYFPTMASRSVAADAVRGIIDRFCNGSVEDLLVASLALSVLRWLPPHGVDYHPMNGLPVADNGVKRGCFLERGS